MSDYLIHYGVKGMRWGVRKSRQPAQKQYMGYGNRHVKTKTGHSLYVRRDSTPAIGRILQKISPSIKERASRSYNCTIIDRGTKVGDIQLYRVSKDEINGTWLGINEKHRGKGYATAVLKDSVSYARDNGYKYFTLEVPGISPDARHIYESQGFVAGEQISSSDDVWGGLTRMTKKL